jgi:hypothetical protein
MVKFTKQEMIEMMANHLDHRESADVLRVAKRLLRAYYKRVPVGTVRKKYKEVIKWERWYKKYGK